MFAARLTRNAELPPRALVATPMNVADECRRRVLPRLGRAPVTVYLCQVRHRVCLKFLNTVVCFLVAGDPRSVGTPLLEEEEELLHAVGFRESVGFHCSFTSYFILHNS